MLFGRLATLAAAAALLACQASPSDDGRAARLTALLGAQPSASTAPGSIASAAPKPAAPPASAAPARRRFWEARPEPSEDRRLAASPDDARRLSEGPLNPKVPHDRSIHSLLEDFPWGDDLEGVWPGTGSADPDPLKPVPNAEMLRRAVTDGYTDTRHHALISVARRQLPDALKVIARAQRQEEPTTIREAAVAALIEHGRAEALPLMWSAMGDPDPFVRGNAVWAIALYGHAQALKAIKTALDDPHPYVVGMGILATTALRDEADFWPILERVVTSPEQQVFQEAAYVLAQVDAEHARDLLRREYDRSKGDRRATFRWYLRENLRRRLY